MVETQRYELVFLPETDGRTDGQGNETVETKYTLKQHQASVRILLCTRGILPLCRSLPDYWQEGPRAEHCPTPLQHHLLLSRDDLRAVHQVQARRTANTANRICCNFNQCDALKSWKIRLADGKASCLHKTEQGTFIPQMEF